MQEYKAFVQSLQRYLLASFPLFSVWNSVKKKFSITLGWSGLLIKQLANNVDMALAWFINYISFSTALIIICLTSQALEGVHFRQLQPGRSNTLHHRLHPQLSRGCSYVIPVATLYSQIQLKCDLINKATSLYRVQSFVPKGHEVSLHVIAPDPAFLCSGRPYIVPFR